MIYFINSELSIELQYKSLSKKNLSSLNVSRNFKGKVWLS